MDFIIEIILIFNARINNHLIIINMLRIITFITTGWTLFTIVIFIIDRWRWISDFFKRIFKKPVDLSYNNDDFAKNTIEFRFRNIMYDINDTFEDAALSLGMKKIKRPLSFDEYYKGIFQVPDCSYLSCNNKADEELLKSFYAHYSDDYEGKMNKVFMKNAPFIDVEHAFYFYILNKLHDLSPDIKEYMCDGTSGVFDPYKLQKKKSIQKDIERSAQEHESSRILQGLDAVMRFKMNDFSSEYPQKDLITDLIIQSLNTNSYDLSQLKGMGWHEIKAKDDNLSGAAKFVGYLDDAQRGVTHTVNYLVDNAGVEFFADLVLGYAMIHDPELRIERVIYHVNVLPIYVSDVIESDLDYTFRTVEYYIKKETSINQEHYLKALFSLKEMFEGKNPPAEIRADFIWNMPCPYEDIPRRKEVYSNPQELLIVKGDLNYRRLCRDKSWHYSKKLNDLTDYIDSPTLVIRSFKSNVILDYSRKKVKLNDEEDKDWRTNGEYGVITFMEKKGTS